VKHLEFVRVVLANGTLSESAEAALLTLGYVPECAPSLLTYLLPDGGASLPPAHAYNPSARRVLYEPLQAFMDADLPCQSTAGAVHVAIMTPGRLVHHLQSSSRQLLGCLDILVRAPPRNLLLVIAALPELRHSIRTMHNVLHVWQRAHAHDAAVSQLCLSCGAVHASVWLVSSCPQGCMRAIGEKQIAGVECR
jgi:hypothetical protein